MPEIKWEKLKVDESDHCYINRCKVPGGWFVNFDAKGRLMGYVFYPDPEHQWDGGSLK